MNCIMFHINIYVCHRISIKSEQFKLEEEITPITVSIMLIVTYFFLQPTFYIEFMLISIMYAIYLEIERKYCNEDVLKCFKN